MGSDVDWMMGQPMTTSGGTFGRNTSRSFRDFQDGLTNSLLIGERRSPMIVNGMYLGGDGIWAGVGCDSMPQGMAMELGDCASTHPLNKGFATAPTSTSADSYIGFSSMHIPAEPISLLGDGSARFISDSIASGPSGVPGSIYQNLATIADGVVLGQFLMPSTNERVPAAYDSFRSV